MMAMVPPGARLSTVPLTVTAGPPGASVTPGATTKAPDGFAETTEPPTVILGGLGAAAGRIVTV
jgi:hypothetical protein